MMRYAMLTSVLLLLLVSVLVSLRAAEPPPPPMPDSSIAEGSTDPFETEPSKTAPSELDEPNATAKSDSDSSDPSPLAIAEPKPMQPEPPTEPGSAPPANTALLAEPDLTPEQLSLRQRVRDTLSLYSTKHLNTRDHSPWEVMHGFVSYNVQAQIRRDGPTGTPVNAIGWLLWGGRCNGQQIITLRGGKPHAEEGPGVQGHPAQLLAILAQSRVSAKTPMKIGGKDFTLQDLINEEKLDCRPGTELTFKLIGLTHYLKTDEKWTSRDGQEWSIPRLIREEIKQPVRGAACGGTHRLFGLSYAYKTRAKRGEPVDGEYLRAKNYIADYHRYTRSLQNPDGSFSTEWFARRGDRSDIDRKIQTTGHILEWLVFSLNDEQLASPKTMKAVDFIARTLYEDQQRTWSIGPMGHALHALMMYDERVFRPRTPGSPGAAAAVATRPSTTQRAAAPGESSPKLPSLKRSSTKPNRESAD